MIAAPSESLFRASFDAITPAVSFLDLPLGRTAYYLLRGASSQDDSEQQVPQQVPIILVHGVCTPALGMLPIARELQKREPTSQILLFDLWGHGLSSSPAVPHSSSTVHKQLLGLLSHLHWTSVNVVGYSLGGSLAVSFSALYPSKVHSLFLIAPVGLLRQEDVKEDLHSDDMIHIPRDAQEEIESEKRILTWLEGSPTIVVPQDWKERTAKGQLVAPALRQWQQDHHAGHVGSVLSYFRSGNVFNADDSFHTVSRLNIPTRTVLGEQDDCCSTARLDKVGLSDHSVIPNSTHGLARDNVPEVVDSLVDFLQSLP